MKIVSLILLLFTTSLYASEDMPAIFYTSLNKTKTTTTPLLKNPLMPDTVKGKVVFKINGKNCDECYDKNGVLKPLFYYDEYGDQVAWGSKEGKVFPDAKFCFECYNDYAKKFVKMFEKFKKIQAKYQKQKHPSKKLKRLDDFRISKTGVLIHEECFDKGRLKFDMEKAIVDAYVTTFTKLIRIEKRQLEEFTGEPSAILKSHVPRLVNLLDKNSWTKEKSVFGLFKNAETDEQMLEEFKKPCKDLKKYMGSEALNNKCTYVKEAQVGRQKIFCDFGEIMKRQKKFLPNNIESESMKAYASTPLEPFPIIKTRNGKTKIYGTPSIAFLPDTTKDWTSERFQSTFIHETFHNLGYEDESQSENPYTYLCQAAIFYQKTHMDVMSNSLASDATQGCVNSSYDFHTSHTAADISDAILGDQDGSF